jgi:hypothetical protein
MEAEDIGPFPQKEDDANKIKDLFIREQLLENSPSDIRDRRRILAILLRPFGFIAFKNIKLIGFPIFQI